MESTIDRENPTFIQEDSIIRKDAELIDQSRNFQLNQKILSNMAQGKQKMSAQTIKLSSPLQESMLFIAMVCSTLQYFAMVVLIPQMCSEKYRSLTNAEVGILLVTSTSGELVSNRYTEVLIDKLGIRWSLHVGFLLQVTASYVFWQVSYLDNDQDFLVLGFLTKMVHGIGTGTLKSVCLVARASNREYKYHTHEDHFQWILLSESLGFILGPLLVAIMAVYQQLDYSNDIFLMLAVATSCVWILFTACFSEVEPVKNNLSWSESRLRE